MIEMKHVVKRYASSKAELYVEHLTIPNGEIVGILGDNGSGKTTLLKAIMGLGELHLGEISFDGKPVWEKYGQVAFITEEGSYRPELTPIQYGDFLADFFPRFDGERYRSLLASFGLAADRRIKTFSKGQRMKLEISAGLAKRADYVLMDEPFVGKDYFSRRDFLTHFVSYLRGDETVLIATHLIDEIEHVIDRALILRDGLIRADFYIDDIREQGKSLADMMLEVRTSAPVVGSRIFR